MAKERGHQTDEDLKRLVSDALFIDPKVTIGSEIVVLVEDGEVTLRGSVGTFGDKREANKAASRVDGVQSVKDELKVFGLTDSDLRRDVLEALELDTRIPATIDVTVTEGFVTLLGVVESQHQRDAAGFIARNVPGVVEGENQISIKDAGESAQGLDEPDGGEVEGTNGELLNRIEKLDRALTGAGETSRRELEARLATVGRRIDGLRRRGERGAVPGNSLRPVAGVGRGRCHCPPRCAHRPPVVRGEAA